MDDIFSNVWTRNGLRSDIIFNLERYSSKYKCECYSIKQLDILVMLLFVKWYVTIDWSMCSNDLHFLLCFHEGYLHTFLSRVTMASTKRINMSQFTCLVLISKNSNGLNCDRFSRFVLVISTLVQLLLLFSIYKKRNSLAPWLDYPCY